MTSLDLTPQRPARQVVPGASPGQLRVPRRVQVVGAEDAAGMARDLVFDVFTRKIDVFLGRRELWHKKAGNSPGQSGYHIKRTSILIRTRKLDVSLTR